MARPHLSAPKRPHLVVLRGGPPSEADAHLACPPPAPTEVGLWRVLRVAGLLLVLAPAVLAGAAVVGWVAYQIALWLTGVAGGP